MYRGEKGERDIGVGEEREEGEIYRCRRGERRGREI